MESRPFLHGVGFDVMVFAHARTRKVEWFAINVVVEELGFGNTSRAAHGEHTALLGAVLVLECDMLVPHVLERQ